MDIYRKQYDFGLLLKSVYLCDAWVLLCINEDVHDVDFYALIHRSLVT